MLKFNNCNCMNKTCNMCKIEKNIELFHKDKSHSDGRRSSCSECCSKIKKSRIKKEYPVTTNKYKLCTKCKKDLEIQYFHRQKSKTDGLMSHCVFCRTIKTQEYYINNREIIKEKTNTYYYEHKEQTYETRKIYQKNKMNDPFFVLQRRLRNRLYYALKKTTWKKNTKFSEYIGCDLETLRKHIESKFQEGMTWENQGKWHIDHIIPLSSAKTEEELYKLCHYNNLQPLWAIDNIKKGTKV